MLRFCSQNFVEKRFYYKCWGRYPKRNIYPGIFYGCKSTGSAGGEKAFAMAYSSFRLRLVRDLLQPML